MNHAFSHLSSQERRDSILKCQAGILVTDDYKEAVKHCRERVKRLAKECKAGNRKFRDLEFDLIEDRDRCLYQLGHGERFSDVADVRRVTEMAPNRQFFVDGVSASDICQGALGDCWFLSALAVAATTRDVIQKICVAKDQDVGIYGFIFWRDSGWAEVIIDDLLCTKIPPWNELGQIDRGMFKNDKKVYKERARQGLFENLYFAKCKTDNETWVPLIEKAYAKLHGDYESLDRGLTSQGVEDLTGSDILDTEKFWKEELMKVGKDRLFACFTPGTAPGAMEDTKSQDGEDNEGLMHGHAYSIIKAITFPGENGSERKFLRIRNPWGRKEWSGRWSDGSKEWSKEYCHDCTYELRKKLGDSPEKPYEFGDDGEFIQEFAVNIEEEVAEKPRSKSTLREGPESALEADPAQAQSPNSRSPKRPKKKETVIVLAQRDTRAFRRLSGPYQWSMDFSLYREGGEVPIARSVHSDLWDRSVKLEVKLRPGKYVVQARLDCKHNPPPSSPLSHDWRKYHRKQMARAASAIIASNCHDHSLLSKHLILRPRSLAGSHLGEVELREHTAVMKARKDTEMRLAIKNGDQSNAETPNPTPPETSSRTISILSPSGFSEEPMVQSPTSEHPPSQETASGNGPSRRKSTKSKSVSFPKDPTRYLTALSSQDSVSLDNNGDEGSPKPVPQTASSPMSVTTRSLGCVSNTKDNWQLPNAAHGTEAREEIAITTPNSCAVPSELVASPDSQKPFDNTEDETIHSAQMKHLLDKSHSYRHKGFFCKGCDQEVMGPMVHCIDIMCHDLNLCIKCKDLRIHPEDHLCIVSQGEEDDLAIRCNYDAGGSPCDIFPPSDLILGLRVYAVQPYKATVKGQLRTGSVLRDHYFTPKPIHADHVTPSLMADSLVFTKVRPWDALEPHEREIYRNDRADYNTRVRKGLFTNLYFGKSKTDNETWVPLIEKAYAKLHGDYESLELGFTSEGVEDLTGGVSTIIYRGDIPDTEHFWKEELSRVGQTRLFACFAPGSTPGGFTYSESAAIEGLFPNHAYSIIKAIEFTGPDGIKRKFLRIRNPWGKKEWSGRWSDGSAEWNQEWTVELRKQLGGYLFGDDGEFVQEYSDFLQCWGIIERSIIFEGDWVMSSQWLQMPSDTHLRPWSHGEVSFTVAIAGEADTKSETIIVLAQRDTRYFKEISGPYLWNLDFLLYRNGESIPIARSVHSTMWDRSVKLEIDLEPGRYVVHARLDCKRRSVNLSASSGDWRKRHRKQMEQAASTLIAANCDYSALPFRYLSVPLTEVAGRDLSEVELRLSYQTLKARATSSHKRTGPPSSLSLYGVNEVESPRVESPMEIRRPTRGYTGDLRQDTIAPTFPGKWPSMMLDRSMTITQPSPPPQESDPVVAEADLSTSPQVLETPLSDSWEDIARTKLNIAKASRLRYQRRKGFVCHNCQREISGPVIRCLEIMCHRCYLCVDCMEVSLHRDHKFVVSTDVEDDQLIEEKHWPGYGTKSEPQDDSDPPSDLILGLRVYTRGKAKAVVKGQLRTGSILRSHVFTPKTTIS
ncbi:hypothetical protein FRB90_011937 [Tulasnella sp. 427]|nr:hypothetical protein FRB90_011937 [Tulasnella sp. 427]